MYLYMYIYIYRGPRPRGHPPFFRGLALRTAKAASKTQARPWHFLPEGRFICRVALQPVSRPRITALTPDSGKLLDCVQ